MTEYATTPVELWPPRPGVASGIHPANTKSGLKAGLVRQNASVNSCKPKPIPSSHLSDLGRPLLKFGTGVQFCVTAAETEDFPGNLEFFCHTLQSKSSKKVAVQPAALELI